MVDSPYRRLDALISDATLVSLEVDERSRQALLRLAVPPTGEPGSNWQRGTFLLHGVSRVACWLRQMRYRPDPGHPQSRPGRVVQVPVADGPPRPVLDLSEFNGWLRRWSGRELAGQPGEVFDARAEPPWVDWPSLDLGLAGPPPGAALARSRAACPR